MKIRSHDFLKLFSKELPIVRSKIIKRMFYFKTKAKCDLKRSILDRFLS